MRVITDTRANARTAAAPALAATSLRNQFRYEEHQVTCPSCNSRIAFREIDTEVTMTGRIASFACPIDAEPIKVDIRVSATAASLLGKLALSTLNGTTGGGFAAAITGKRAGSVLSIGAGSAAGFAISGGTNLTAAAGVTAGQKKVNVVETAVGVFGSPHVTTFYITIA